MMNEDLWPQPVLDLLAADGDRVVFENGPELTTGSELLSLIRRAAAGYRARGIGPGDGVALGVGVDAPGLAATLAAFAVGATVTGLRAELTPHQLTHILERDRAVLIDDAAVAELLAHPDTGVPIRAGAAPGDVARVISTSGSTGVPKGCLQTYAALSADWPPFPDRWPPTVADLASRFGRYLVFGSLASQVMIKYGIVALAAGGTLVVADPPGFPHSIVRHRATASVITVGKLHQLVRSQREHPVDLGTLRALLVSGSPLQPGLLAEAIEALGPVVFHGYGQTETGLIALISPDEMTASPAVLSSVGRPSPEVDISLRDGELYVRTPSQAFGYRDNPIESAEVFVDDGWIRTRDLAEIDDDGYLRLRGRTRDVVIVNANLVYAGPIERVLAAQPGVAEAYVVGRPDDVTGEAVHAFVVPRPGGRVGDQPDPELLRRAIGDELGPDAVPRTVTFIDQVPVALSGKPDKRALEALHRSAPSGVGTTAGEP